MTDPARGRGPFYASQLRAGDPYELSAGHPVRCAPGGGRGGASTLRGGAVVDSDPSAPAAGTDVGFELDAQTLRAPDVAVGGVEDRPGWARGVPALAIEYADTGQDERSLSDKIDELFAAGTRWVWVVRLVGDKHVEVHERGKKVKRVVPGQQLRAPGVLSNPVPIEALWDRDAAHDATLRNLVNRKGFASFEAAREAAREEGREEGAWRASQATLLQVLEARGIALSARDAARIRATTEVTQLSAWIGRAAVATSLTDVFGDR